MSDWDPMFAIPLMVLVFCVVVLSILALLGLLW